MKHGLRKPSKSAMAREYADLIYYNTETPERKMELVCKIKDPVVAARCAKRLRRLRSK